MEWYRDFDFIFEQFERGNELINETVFYFKSDPNELEHYIGYSPQYDEPYWAGLCDIPGGCSFSAATELFEAKIYDGRSIRDRWDELVLVEINGLSVMDVDESRFWRRGDDNRGI